jgi:tetratricopeptide (TPR) repeat protein
MQRIAALLILLSLILSAPAWGQAGPQSSGNTIYFPPSTGGMPAQTDEDAKLGQLLASGVDRVKAKRQQEAIFMFFDRVASVYEAKYRDKNTSYYCARHTPEMLFYMLQAATDQKSGRGVPMNWATSYFLKGYALMELNRPADARQSLQQAITLSPQNAQFLSELGYAYQIEKDWPAALDAFKRASEAAQQFSPQPVQSTELRRAWRGMGFALVEMKRTDEAEALYRKCLELDQNDAAAKHELLYVQSLKSKKTP